MNIRIPFESSSLRSIHDRISSVIVVALFGMLITGGIACQEPGYRNEVVTGEQGSVQVKHVPYTQEEVAARQASAAPAPVQQPPPAQPPVPPVDPDLGQVQSLWPELSPADRKIVVDMAKRLAKPAP